MTAKSSAPFSASSAGLTLDERIRGVPPGLSGLDSGRVGELGWHPAGGAMSLPVMTLDEEAFVSNRDLMLRYVRSHGAEIAPHAKTPMSPELARILIAGGAWGTTVADVRQASVMARAGLGRLILANEVGGPGGARRLAGFAASHPECEIYVFADSVAAVMALQGAWDDHPALAPLPVLVEAGTGRAGTRTLAEACSVADAVLSSKGRLRLAGAAAYEGNSIQPSADATRAAITELLFRLREVFQEFRARLGPKPRLILTAGGSLFFDRVVEALAPVARADGNATLILRSGTIFFSDHGLCDRGLTALDERGGFVVDGSPVLARRAFRPALRLWAEVLSRPEPRLALAGLGMRDASFDQGFPVVLRVHRGGVPLAQPNRLPSLVKLNDQHGFLEIESDCNIAVGDVVEFGITHACTSFDRYRVIFGLDGGGIVRHAFATEFG